MGLSARLFGRGLPGGGVGATADVCPDGVAVTCDAPADGRPDTRIFTYAEVSLDWGGADGDQLRLSLADDDRTELFVRDGAACLAALADRGPPAMAPRLAFLADQRRWHRRLFFGTNALATAAVVVVAVVCWWALTAFESYLVHHVIPPSVELALSKAAAPTITRGYATAPPALTNVVATMGRRLVEAWPDAVRERYGDTVTFTVVQDEQVNAFALPGGPVYVFTGLLAFAERPDEVAGVLAHELSHVANRDGLARVVGEFKWQLLFGLLFGDPSSTERLLATNTRLLFALKYSRVQESRADADGLALMAQAGYDPTAMPAFFERLADREDVLTAHAAVLSDHPATVDRVRMLRTMLAERSLEPVRTVPTTSRLDWQSVRQQAERGDGS